MSCFRSLALCLCCDKQTCNSRTVRPYQNRVAAHCNQSGRKIGDKRPARGLPKLGQRAATNAYCFLCLCPFNVSLDHKNNPYFYRSLENKCYSFKICKKRGGL